MKVTFIDEEKLSSILAANPRCEPDTNVPGHWIYQIAVPPLVIIETPAQVIMVSA